MCVVVERAKKCLDFTATVHLIHLCCTVMYDGFPGSWEWWVINFVSVVVMALLGEFLCMRREMQARDTPPSRLHLVLCARVCASQRAPCSWLTRRPAPHGIPADRHARVLPPQDIPLFSGRQK